MTRNGKITRKDCKMTNSKITLKYLWKITFVLFILIYISTATTTVAQTPKERQEAQIAVSKADQLYYDG